ncbi:MAG: type II toxin-antitoxin system VapC family toxin [Chloroflexi bacterium]|nr:type II toxin-antitoxin system VapC family toxin [Chloroflexota bacterium]
MILIDTSVLHYAVGSDYPLKDPCVRIIQRLAPTGSVATTFEVVQEFMHVFSRRRPRELAVDLARSYAIALQLLPVTSDDLQLGISLFEAIPGLGGFDCVLAAVALNRHVEALVSADRGFGEVDGLPWLDPRSPDLARLVER